MARPRPLALAPLNRDSSTNRWVKRHGEPIHVVNPSEKVWSDHSYLIRIPCGYFIACTLLAYGDDLSDAIESAAEWLAENKPGLMVEPEDVEPEYLEEEAIYTESGYFPNIDRHLVVEDPSKKELIRVHRQTH